MTPEAMQAWLGAFAACVAKLGGTLADLHGQLQRQHGSQRTQRIIDHAKQVVGTVEVVEQAMEALREGVPKDVGAALKIEQKALKEASLTLCKGPVRVARRWTRALSRAIAIVDEEAHTLHDAIAAVGLLTRVARSQFVCVSICFYVFPSLMHNENSNKSQTSVREKTTNN